MNIVGVVRDDGACGYYRVSLPLRTLGKNTDHNVGFVEKGDPADVIFKKFSQADVAVIPRPHEPQWISVIKQLKDKGIKSVVEYDDNLFNISPLSPHYQDFGTENIEVDHGGKKLPLWEDGKNIDLKANKEKLDNVKRTLELADAVQVTTDILADVYLEYAQQAFVLPNCIDTKLWNKLPLKRDKEETRLFWSGGSSHFEDWVQIQGVIPHLMEKYKDLKLVLLGTKFDGTLKGVPSDRIEYHNWVPTPAHPYKCSVLDPDICVIPLKDTDFNRCKSAIKWIEMGGMSVPSVASAISPYIEMDAGSNGVFIEDNAFDGWVDGLSLLIEDKMLRWKMGGEAKKTVDQYFDINKRYTLWEAAYQELLDGN